MEAAAATAPERHLEAVYDYVLRIVRDREVAADVVRATFADARDHGGSEAGWLFAAARERALAAVRFRRHRNGALREALDFTQLDGDRVPSASVLFDKELVELVWDAAAALPPEDYSLLALHVRHDLSVEELGAHFGAKGAVTRRVVRARETLEERVTTELVVRRARHNCRELEIVLHDTRRDQVVQHIHRCARCHESRARFVSPVGVLRGLAAIPPDRGLERELLAAQPRRRRRFGIL